MSNAQHVQHERGADDDDNERRELAQCDCGLLEGVNVIWCAGRVLVPGEVRFASKLRRKKQHDR